MTHQRPPSSRPRAATKLYLNVNARKGARWHADSDCPGLAWLAETRGIPFEDLDVEAHEAPDPLVDPRLYCRHCSLLDVTVHVLTTSAGDPITVSLAANAHARPASQDAVMRLHALASATHLVVADAGAYHGVVAYGDVPSTTLNFLARNYPLAAVPQPPTAPAAAVGTAWALAAQAGRLVGPQEEDWALAAAVLT